MEPAGLAQLVEQLFRKQQVSGSSPEVGSSPATSGHIVHLPKWRNWQTRYVQGVVRVTSWEFKSPLRHRGSLETDLTPCADHGGWGLFRKGSSTLIT